MILPSPFLVLFLHSPLISALPNPLSSRQIPTTAAETWHIPRLNMHMMSVNTGIPGNGPWPEDSKFNSTIDFDVLVPEAAVGMAKWNCQGEMKNGTLMEGVVECMRDGDSGGGEDGEVAFGMQPYTAVGERRAELSFWLWVYRAGYVSAVLVCSLIPFLSHTSTYPLAHTNVFILCYRSNGASGTGVLQGATAITANDLQEPSSYLTCLLGRPFDGLRCDIGSYLSVRTELVVEGSAVDAAL
jgi:hypothetical protein